MDEKRIGEKIVAGYDETSRDYVEDVGSIIAPEPYVIGKPRIYWRLPGSIGGIKLPEKSYTEVDIYQDRLIYKIGYFSEPDRPVLHDVDKCDSVNHWQVFTITQK